MSNPTPVNSTATTADQIIHDLVCTVAVQAAEKAAKLALPFLNLPIVSLITDETIQFVAQEIYKTLALSVTFDIIDAQTSAEAAAVQSAADQVKAAVASGVPSAIAIASQNFQNAFGKLVNFNGSASP